MSLFGRTTREEEERLRRKALMNIGEEKKPKFGSGITDFFFGRTKDVMELDKGGRELKIDSTVREKETDEVFRQSRDLIKRAKETSDPEEKKRLLQQSRDMDEQMGKMADIGVEKGERLAEKTGITEDTMDRYERIRKEKGDKAARLDFARKKSLGMAGELATYSIPVGKAAKFKKGVSVVKQLLGSKVAMDAVSGFIYSATDEESENFQEAMKAGKGGAITAMVVGGVLRNTFGKGYNAAKNYIRNNPDKMIARLFRVPNKVYSRLRTSSGGKIKGAEDFGAYILENDAEEIAGKTYREIQDHFEKRFTDASGVVEDKLSKMDDTVPTKEIIDQTEKMIKKLAPEEGNVGQSNAIKTLKGLIKDLKENPKDLDLVSLNRIKGQVQDIAESAFDGSGKPLPGEKQAAELSRYIKQKIEKIASKNGVDIAADNLQTQIYRAAKKAISTAGDADVNRIASDGVAKFLQTLGPSSGALIGAGLGFATGGGASSAAAGATIGLMGQGIMGNVRNKWLSPQVQTKVANNMMKLLKSKGIKIAEPILTGLISKIVRRVSQTDTAKTMTGQGDTIPQPGPAPTVPGLPDSAQPEGTPTPSPEGTPAPEEEVAGGKYRIKDNVTGEILEVGEEELSKYGFDEKGGALPEDDARGLPSDEDILMAIMIDIQTNKGKNVSDLKTFMQLRQSMDDDGGEPLGATQSQRRQLARSGLRASEDVERLLKEDPDSLTKQLIPGQFASRELDNALYRAADTILRLRTGAQANETEVRMYMRKFMPYFGDSPEIAQVKINNLLEEFDDVMAEKDEKK